MCGIRSIPPLEKVILAPQESSETRVLKKVGRESVGCQKVTGILWCQISPRTISNSLIELTLHLFVSHRIFLKV
jgi:hypothetical protein